LLRGAHAGGGVGRVARGARVEAQVLEGRERVELDRADLLPANDRRVAQLERLLDEREVGRDLLGVGAEVGLDLAERALDVPEGALLLEGGEVGRGVALEEALERPEGLRALARARLGLRLHVGERRLRLGEALERALVLGRRARVARARRRVGARLLVVVDLA